MQKVWAFMKTSYEFIFVNTKIKAISEYGSPLGVLDAWESSEGSMWPAF